MFLDIFGGLGKGDIRRKLRRECSLKLRDLVRAPLILVTCSKSCEINPSESSEKDMVLVIIGDTIQHEGSECAITL